MQADQKPLSKSFVLTTVQDFRSAYYGWNAVYGTMTCTFESSGHAVI
jgi:hypothetical protein